MQNKGIYSLAALALLLGGLYIALPSNINKLSDQKEPESSLNTQQASQNQTTPNKTQIFSPNVSAQDAQNYKFLNAKIVALTKQLNIIKASNSKESDQQIYSELYAKLEKLNRDNESLKRINESLSEKVSNAQLLINQDTKENYTQLINKLNDELAFYKSDNDNLKLSISEKDNAINNLNSLLNTLYNQRQMDDFEHDSTARKLQKELDDAKAKIAAGLKNNADLSKENQILKERVNNLSKLEIINQSISKEQANLNMQVLKLQQELKAEQHSNEELRKNAKSTESKLSLDNKNLHAQLEDANARILKLAGQNNDLTLQLKNKKQVQAQAEEYKNELLKQKLNFEKDKAANVQELSQISANNQKALDSLNKELDKQNAANSQLSEKVNKLTDEKNSLELKNKELNTSLDATQKKLTSSEKELSKYKESSQKLSEISKDYKDQIETLKKEKITLTSKINVLNQEFLDYKNNNFDRSYKDYAQMKDKLMKLSISYDELKAKNLALKDELANKELDYKALSEKTSTLENNLKLSKNNDNSQELAEKIAKLETANENLLKELDEAHLKQLERFNEQNSELISMREQNAALKNQLANASSKNSYANMQEIASISCGDLRSGSTELSESCKLNLQGFLSKYNDSYYFEITPIINNGGFRSLSRLSASQMQPEEVARLTKLANYGLSKDRVIAARDFIKSEMPNALVAISSQTSTSNNEKGFILKVYK